MLLVHLVLIHLVIHNHLVSLICYVSGILAPISKTPLPKALKLSESLAEAALVSIEHTLVSSFFVDPAKSAETSSIILMYVSILLMLALKLVNDSFNDVSIEAVCLNLRFGFHVLVLHIHGVEFGFIALFIV